MLTVEQGERRVLFAGSFTEFCERYSFYMLQGLLIFYLIDHFHISEKTSATLVGTVISVVYISSILGGYVADKLLTYYTAALLGSFLMVFGVGCLAALNTQTGLFLGLALISISTGLIKSNISSFIGRFYSTAGLSDSHRDFGFNIFYMGINLGAWLALFFASYIKNHFGFATAFYSSLAFVMLMFINLFWQFFRLEAYVDKPRISLPIFIKTLSIIVSFIAAIFILLKYPEVADFAILLAAALCIIVLIVSAQGKYWVNVLVALVFFTLSVVYWSLYFQMFISILLFIERFVSHQLFSFTLGSSQFVGMVNLGDVIFGIFMGKLWLSFGKKGRAVHDIDKFNLAFIITVISFAICYLATHLGDMNHKVPALPYILFFLILSIGELSLSAIGLSCVTKIAPKGYVSLYMGVWLVTIGLGGKLAGVMSSWIVIDQNIVTSRINMSHGLLMIIAIAAISSIVCFLVRKPIINAKLDRAL